jgi:hypothetical protein
MMMTMMRMTNIKFRRHRAAIAHKKKMIEKCVLFSSPE